MPETMTDSISDHPTVAYLVIRDGNGWSESYQLNPGQVTTMGRATTNRVVLRDDLCSRTHCEVFVSGNRWTLRDLSSRNGTFINGQRIDGDYELEPDELIEIGQCDLAFTYDLSLPIAQFERLGDLERDTDPALNVIFDQENHEQPEIVHR
jgi:Nif-specific regulatory protein